MKILVTGSSGFLGRTLMTSLAQSGNEVRGLLRRKVSDAPYWLPEEMTLNLNGFEPVDVIIHLAGENIASGRWSRNKKRALFSSRVDSTLFLSDFISKMAIKPRLFLSGSAIGYYGNRSDKILDEESSVGSGFLANLCSEWESATNCIPRSPTRVIHLRTGVVLDQTGGVLGKQLWAFQWGLGAVLGSGEQFISWITLEDWIQAILFLIQTPEISGAVNLVSPEPVTQKVFAKALAHKLHRPLLLRLPTFALTLSLGEMGKELLLSSQRAVPQKLLKAGYLFRHPTLDVALSYLLDPRVPHARAT